MSGKSDTANSFFESESQSETDPELELESESEYPDFSKQSICLFPFVGNFGNIGSKSEGLFPESNKNRNN